MSFNYSKLSGRIKEKYGSQCNFAKAMQLSERSLSLKMSGKRGWKQDEISKACDVLNIDTRQISEYFFKPNVQNIEQSA